MLLGFLLGLGVGALIFFVLGIAYGARRTADTYREYIFRHLREERMFRG